MHRLLAVVLSCCLVSGCQEAVQHARDAHQRKQVKNNLRQVQLAVENYESHANRSVPTNLSFVSWNVESDGNDPGTIAKQLAELGRYDVCALQEVKAENFGRYAAAIRDNISKDFRYFGSTTGRSDRLLIIYDSARLRLIESRELFAFEDFTLNDWRHRSPLVAHFRDRQGDSDFLFVTVHLARGNADLRTEQATGLREWGRNQPLPVVAIGDFNMDYDFPTRKGNAAFDAFMDGSTWWWVQPDEFIDTNWSDRDGDGADNYPESMLDFCFVAGEWGDVSSRVIVRDGDFPDDDKTADHRPVELLIK